MGELLTYHQPTVFIDNTVKASHDDQHSLCLVSAYFCLIISVSIDVQTDVPQLQTVIFQSPAPQLWEMPQNSQHDNKILGLNYHV